MVYDCRTFQNCILQLTLPPCKAPADWPLGLSHLRRRKQGQVQQLGGVFEYLVRARVGRESKGHFLQRTRHGSSQFARQVAVRAQWDGSRPRVYDLTRQRALISVIPQPYCGCEITERMKPILNR